MLLTLLGEKDMKEFFKKIAAYIRNTAWIQPILIVIVIFVILFSLNSAKHQ